MLPERRAWLLGQIPDDALVLDVGGWGSPFSRADWVIDLMPPEGRGLYHLDPDPERFTAETWVQRDICDREPWPFAGGQFDVVVCAHTLEDLRDPVWVCQEISRVGRAGYVEVPSRLVEQCWGVEGPWVGYSHHHWLCELDAVAGEVTVVFKPHAIHAEGRFFGEGSAQRLRDEQTVDWMWWEGELRARERIHMSAETLDEDLCGYVREHAGEIPPPPPPGRRERVRRALRIPARS